MVLNTRNLYKASDNENANQSNWETLRTPQQPGLKFQSCLEVVSYSF